MSKGRSIILKTAGARRLGDIKSIEKIALCSCTLLFLLACFPISGYVTAVAKITFGLYAVSLLLFLAHRLRSNRKPFFDSNVARAIIFLVATHMLKEYAVEQVYNFGADDGFYYSYLPSIIFDRDLDFTNQIRTSGMPEEFLYRATPTGLVRNEYPIGSAIFWSPFFVFGHFIAKLLNLLAGSSVATDGYSLSYINSVIAGNILYCVLGIYFTYRVLSAYFVDGIALISSIAIWLCTSIYVFSTNVYLVSETMAMFSTALLTFMSLTYSRTLNVLKAAFLGIVSGLCILVRLHNIVFLIIPCASIIYFLKIQGSSISFKEIMKIALTFAFGLLLVLIPQLVVWKILEGQWIMSAGQYLQWWKSPRVFEVLFSARKGLFPWTPLTFLTFLGLFKLFKTNRISAALALLVLGLITYINSSQPDWWGSTSFGGRRFTNSFVIFSLGLASFFSWLWVRYSKKGILSVVLIIALFWNLNMFLTRSFRRGRLQYEHADRFADVLNTKHYPIFLPIVYSLQFPVQSYYTLKFGLPFYGHENEFIIGEDILYFQLRHGNLLMGRDNPLFGNGWRPRETNTKYGVARIMDKTEAVIRIPMFFKNNPTIWMRMSLRYNESDDSSVRMNLFLNDIPIMSKSIGPKGKTIAVPLFQYPYKRGMNLVKIRLDGKTNVEREKELRSLALESLTFTTSSHFDQDAL